MNRKRDCQQFLLLSWKNLIHMSRNLSNTICMFLMGLLFPVLLLISKSKLDIVTVKEGPIIEPSFEITTRRQNHLSRLVLAYTPNDERTKRILERAASYMSGETWDVIAYDMEADLEDELKNSTSIFAGIVFLNDTGDMYGRKHISTTYKIRITSESFNWLTHLVMPSDGESSGPRQGDEMKGGDVPGYFSRGFLTLQRAIDSSIIAELGGEVSNMKTFLKKMAFPSYSNNPFLKILKKQFASSSMFGFLLALMSICGDVVSEKHRKLKEFMRLFDLKAWVYWLSWFFKYAVLTGLFTCLMTIIYHLDTGNGAILSNTSPLITFSLLYLYSLASIVLFLAVTTFFDKERIASFAGAIIFFIMYGLESYCSSKYNSMSSTAKILASLCPNIAFGLGCDLILKFEGTACSGRWNAFCPAPGGFSLLQVFGMLLVDILLFGIITWYVDAIHPGEFGWPRPFYFLLQKEYWCRSTKADSESDVLLEDNINYGSRSDYFEPNNPANNIGIRIRKLSKIFKKGSKPAVKELSLDICEGHIMALLGHNGAGKTTTMSMLTGFVIPTGGKAWISGFSVNQNMTSIRKNMGYCPQVNIHFDNMTVKENLYFFAKLKDPSMTNIDREMTAMLNAFSLRGGKDTLSKNVSGGMKRKLSIAMALIGDSKFVILDEPTSGLDPEARREIWNILKSHRQGRTMILSTHYMDEADHLGDKIAIMTDGVLQCYGSSMFLKKKYGIGYHLTISKTETCNTSKIYEMITNGVSGAQLKGSAGSELTYHLPKESSACFSSLFSRLEEEKSSLGIDSFGVSVTTLEEVFIRVGELCEQESGVQNEKTHFNEHFNVSDSKMCELTLEENIEVNEEIRNEGLTLILSRMCAMMHKRFLYTCRNIMITLAQLALPTGDAIFACFSVAYFLKNTGSADSEPLFLDLMKYSNPTTVYATTDKVQGNNLTECYKRAIGRMPGTQLYLNDNGDYSNETDMDDFFIKVAEDDILGYILGYPLAVEIGHDYFKGFYNDESYHTMAIVLSLIDNAWLKCLVNSSDDLEIRTINHPIDTFSTSKYYGEESVAAGMGFLFSLLMSYGLTCLVATFSIFLISERRTGAKFGQYVSGGTPLTFWTATFIWDYFNYLVPSLLVVAIMRIFGLEYHSHSTITKFVLLSLMAYGWASIPLTYLFSFLFSKGSKGFNYISILYLLTGIVPMIVHLILHSLEIQSKNLVDGVFIILFPNFCLAKNLEIIVSNLFLYNFCSSLVQAKSPEMLCSEGSSFRMKCCPDQCGIDCVDGAIDYLSWDHPGIGKYLVAMLLQGCAIFAVLFAVENDFTKRIKRKFSPSVLLVDAESGSGTEEDADVHEERTRVLDLEKQHLCLDENILVLRRLTKRYGMVTLAVNDVCLKVPLGECFGLLGGNGAGKTSTFKVLTGEETITGGEVYIKGIDVSKDLSKTRKYVGYCPQFDSLVDELTVEEHLVLHARLRGIPMGKMKRYVSNLMQKIDLTKHGDKRTKMLSGGYKRKLCVAMALIGRPKLIFLDEPTTGIDPVARRELWNLLSLVRQTGSTIILTSHSMEECEALCTRLAIMVNGQFKCLGNTQHLKSRFGSGYSVSLKVAQTQGEKANASALEKAKDFTANQFPGSVLEFEGDGLLNYRIDKSIPGATLANIFALVESSKESLQLDDYSVGQATLEQIFINFARTQRSSDPEPRKIICGLLNYK